MAVVCIDDGTDWIWAKSLHTNAIVIYISVPFVFIEHALKQCILSSRNEGNGNIYVYFALSVFIRNRSSNVCSNIILIHNRPRYFEFLFITLIQWRRNVYSHSYLYGIKLYLLLLFSSLRKKCIMYSFSNIYVPYIWYLSRITNKLQYMCSALKHSLMTIIEHGLSW